MRLGSKAVSAVSAGRPPLDSVASVASRAFVRSGANPADYVVGLMYGSMVDFFCIGCAYEKEESCLAPDARSVFL
ncbi:hypothetical protein FJT64_001523 [Amphibalanus amphitrite]|uniref:Uncharacterized protein n=1 Tax=Amphibalanus amphitrite TaxID=1232801 RepID=A0A6A4XDT3_AMPAM|nr:hypothetical protein FJT64_001523 [Amphibalanus amphitrite]